MKNLTKAAPSLIGASALFTFAVTACNTEVIGGEGPDGGGGAGGAPGVTTVGTTTSSSSQQTATSASTTVATTIASSTSTGFCPPDPGFSGCGSTTGVTSGGNAQCGAIYCDFEDGVLFERNCAGDSCTCSGPSGSCTCAWEGDCQAPCCGNPTE